MIVGVAVIGWYGYICDKSQPLSVLAPVWFSHSISIWFTIMLRIPENYRDAAQKRDRNDVAKLDRE